MKKEHLTLQQTIEKAALKGDLPGLEEIIVKGLTEFQSRDDSTLSPLEQGTQTIYLRTLAAIQEYRDNSKLTPPGAEVPLTLLEK
jgi:2-phospho-L-lactate guanylyltransferase (CobY/MobA/RfbA family)